MITIENEMLRVKLCRKGAELRSVYLKETGIEYLWQGDPAYWAKHSPVLFPIVGTLVNNQYSYRGQSYTLPRHGFARDMPFTLTESNNSGATLQLEWNEETWQQYPFKFSLQICYSISGNKLLVEYHVTNQDAANPMYFSLGAHPAFNMPLLEKDEYPDYYLQFDGDIAPQVNPLKDGLLLPEKKPVDIVHNQLQLHKNLFEKDALVFTELNLQSISIRGKNTDHGLRFGMKDWPHLGLWAAPGASFVCIEPWQGHADFSHHNGMLEQKPGIIKLAPNQTWKNSWDITLF